MKCWDKRGLEGLPLKLMIVALMVSLSAPAVLGATEGFERSAARAALELEARSVAAVAEEAYMSGEGNRRTVTIEIPGDEGSDVGLTVGGDVSKAESLTIRCVQGGEVFATVVLDQPMVRLRAPGSAPLVLGAGEHDLMLSCLMIDDRLIVDVQVME